MRTDLAPVEDAELDACLAALDMDALTQQRAPARPVLSGAELYQVYRQQLQERKAPPASAASAIELPLRLEPVTTAPPANIRDNFTQTLLPGMLQPLPPCGRDNPAFMDFVRLHVRLAQEKRCILVACTRRDGHPLDKCSHYPARLCVLCGVQDCPSTRGGACRARLVLPAGAACYCCWLNHDGSYGECKRQGAPNIVRPLLYFVVHYCDLDNQRVWQALLDKGTNRFEVLTKLMRDARLHPQKRDPFVHF